MPEDEPRGRRMGEGRRLHGKGWIGVLVLVVLVAAIGGVVAANRGPDAHRIVIQINSDDPAPMKHAVSNSINLITYYRTKHEPVKIDIVAYGRGIDMFRSDISPVRRILEHMHMHFPEISFVVCGNTEAIMEKQLGRPLSFIAGTEVVPFGIVRIIQLEEAGWSYIRE